MAQDGYLQIEGALSDDQVALFSAELDRFRLEPGWEPGPTSLATTPGSTMRPAPIPTAFMDRRDLLNYGQHFVDLIDQAPSSIWSPS